MVWEPFTWPPMSAIARVPGKVTVIVSVSAAKPAVVVAVRT